MSLKLEFVVVVPSELSAGLRGFTENVSVTFEHTDKAMTDAGLEAEVTDYFRGCIAEWFDVGPKSVATLAEYNMQIARFETAYSESEETPCQS